MPADIPQFDARLPLARRRSTKPSRPQADRNTAGIVGARWRRLRAKVLANEPTCRHCRVMGKTTPATEVDHIVPRRDAPALAYELENLQPLCKSCHSRKTMSEMRGRG